MGAVVHCIARPVLRRAVGKGAGVEAVHGPAQHGAWKVCQGKLEEERLKRSAAKGRGGVGGGAAACFRVLERGVGGPVSSQHMPTGGVLHDVYAVAISGSEMGFY